MNRTEKKARYNAPALEKGLDIVEYLATQPVARTQTEICEALQRSQSEIFRMLFVLERRGYVVKVAQTGSYRLSLRLFELTHRQNITATLRQAALLPMDRTADETGQSVHLSVQHGNDLLVMVERMPPRRICLAVGEGNRMRLAETASGKVLLSRMNETTVEALLQVDEFFAGGTTAVRRQIRAEIGRARKDGILIVESAVTPGAMDIAVPVGIAGSDTDAVADMSFIVHAKDASKVIAEYSRAMLSCAEQINRNLGIHSDPIQEDS